MRVQEWLTPEGLVLLEGWRRKGLSREEIASLIGVSPGTLKSWAGKYPSIREALEVDKDVTDFQVESALLKKALGYETTEHKVEVSPKGDRKEVDTIKQVGPDMSAISFWLKKRMPLTWGDIAAGGPKPENNLKERLSEEGGFDGIPELQPTAETDSDMVEDG